MQLKKSGSNIIFVKTDRFSEKDKMLAGKCLGVCKTRIMYVLVDFFSTGNNQAYFRSESNHTTCWSHLSHSLRV